MVMALDAANFFIRGILGLLGWHSSNAAVADTVAASRRDFPKYTKGRCRPNAFLVRIAILFL